MGLSRRRGHPAWSWASDEVWAHAHSYPPGARGEASAAEALLVFLHFLLLFGAGRQAFARSSKPSALRLRIALHAPLIERIIAPAGLLGCHGVFFRKPPGRNTAGEHHQRKYHREQDLDIGHGASIAAVRGRRG